VRVAYRDISRVRRVREGVAVSAVEVILAALAAGAGAGSSDAAQAAVKDAYTGLRDALSRRMGGRRQDLDVRPDDPESSRARLIEALAETGADRDEEILTAARRLLELSDAEAGPRRAGDTNIRITSSYGPVAGTMTGPVTVTYGSSPPVPPAPPEA
jgi:hypothetical protein